MFDKLVESAKQKQGGRARRLFLTTGVIYAVTLTALGVATVIGFRPALAEEDEFLSILVPPPVPRGPDPNPVQIRPNLNLAPKPRFAPPEKIQPLPNLDKMDLESRPRNLVSGGPYNTTGIGPGAVIPGAPADREAPPPPIPTPTPVVKPTPTPDTVVRLTSKLTQGRVLRKVEPQYPVIAKQVRVQGSVQVQISISETGTVTDVTLLTGHPLLREAAMQAAKQWLFIPTELNDRPVRAIGVLIFNFKLN
jgi:protein TonB